MRLSLLFFLFAFVLTIGTIAAPMSGHPIPGALADPSITCPGDTIIQLGALDCTAVYNYNVTASDDLPNWSLVQTAGLPSGSVFPKGTTLNVFVVTDSDGNTADCAFNVTVKDDVPPTAACSEYSQVFIGPYDNPYDCYDGYVASFYALTFDDGSYDNCSSNLRFTVQRLAPYSEFVLGLNQVNGHPDCDDSFPDFPSEFERAITEGDSIKFYCAEAGQEQWVVLRAYQMKDDGNFDLDVNGDPIFSECLMNVVVEPSVICESPDTSAQLVGLVQLDANGDCLPDINPLGLPNMVVEAKTDQGETVYTVTGTGGAYGLSDLPPGLLEVNVVPYLPIFNVCNNQTSVNVPVGPSATDLDFNALPALNCPLLTVDIAASAVSPCTSNLWPVSYSNKGSVLAQNASVQVKVPAPFNLVDATQPYTIQGEIMTVQVGDVKPGETAQFYVRIQTPCDPNLVGKSLCIEAGISPISACIPTSDKWLGAQIEASAVCDGDSIHFTLKNTGSAPTTQKLDFVIIDDMVIMRQGQVPSGLNPNEEVHQTVKAEGHALRLQSQQEPGHPLAQSPSLLIENCNGVSTSNATLKFKNEDGNPFTDHECQPIVASNNGSQMQAFPNGVGAEHFVEANTRLTYQVDFQNSGSEDVSVVVLRDVIPAQLNPADIRLGASSHPYTWSLSGTGVLEIRFEPIYFPVGTNGFVQFDIAQRADNPIGTIIENSADVYFDIKPAFKTNTSWHTVGKNFLATTGLHNPGQFQEHQITLYPNPASTRTFLQLDATENVQVRLMNMFGQQVATYSAKAPGITLERGKSPAGMYQVEVRLDGAWQKAGKLIWE